MIRTVRDTVVAFFHGAVQRLRSAGVRSVLAFFISLFATGMVGATQPHIATAGDSTVHIGGWNDLRGWGELFDEYFEPDVTVSVTARSGRSTKTFITEGRWQDTLDLNPDYVFIQFGHNDQKIFQANLGTHAVDNPAGPAPGPLDRFRVNLRGMVDDVVAGGGEPILVTSVARRSGYANGQGQWVFDNDQPKSLDVHGNSYSLLDYANATIAVGIEKSVPVINLNQLSLDLYNQMLDNGESLDSFTPLGSTDLTHFSEDGARIIAGLVADEISVVLPSSSLAGALLSATAPGDFNEDGAVDAADYTVWRDGNSPDDTITGYNTWVANFGTGPSSSSGNAIPEPTSCLLLLAMGSVVSLGLRNRF